MDSKKIRLLGMAFALLIGIVAGRVHADALEHSQPGGHTHAAEMTQDVGQ